MSSNKSARKKLEEKYGKECFIDKLHLRKDSKERRYTSKGQMKRMKQLTYHHILEKSKGGKATVDNGAILSNENHIWFHKQSESQQGYMNAIFQEYKRQVDECKVVFVDDLEVPYEVKPMEFSIEDREKSKYNRAEKKREDRKIAMEYVDR